MKRGRFSWIGLALLLVVAAAYTWATWQFFTRPVPGGNDFLAHRSAWDAYLRQGLSPYSDEAALHTQMAIRGRPALPGEDENRLTYPFYSILLHGPFVYIDDYALARAIYMTLLQAALFAGVLMSLDFVRWRPPVWLMALIMIWALLFYPVARGVLLGQFAIFAFFALAGTLFLLRRDRDVAAGALLVLTTFKPTLVFLVIPFLIIWAIFQRRWRFVAGFVGTLAILILGSLLLLPTWISEWLHRIGQYSAYTVGQSPVWLLTRVALPALGLTGEVVIVAVLCLGMLVAWWWAVRPGGEREFFWALAVTLIVTNLIVPRSATTNYVMLLGPILWSFAVLDRVPWRKKPDRHGRRPSPVARLTIVAILLLSFVSLWWMHFATVVGDQEQPIMFIPVPLALGLALVLGRRWFIRDAEAARVKL